MPALDPPADEAMDATLYAETRSRLGELLERECELAHLHGYRTVPSSGGTPRFLCPRTGAELHLGQVMGAIRGDWHRARRAMREAARARAADPRGEDDEQVADDGGQVGEASVGGVHDASIAAPVPARELA